jgi:hypothetical protein
MAQAVQKLPSSADQALATTTLTTIPGLVIEILTGAGWIFLTLSMLISSTYAGTNLIYARLKIDNQPLLPPNAILRIAQNVTGSFSFRWAFKLGAGQHTIEAQASSSDATANIVGLAANLILEEPGY